MIKKIIVIICFILVFAVSSIANDTLVISHGDTIHPVGETLIKIERENLSIIYNETTRFWDVEVDFIFYNPTDQVIKEQVAFVNESVPYEDYNYKIVGFTTQVNGLTIPFDRKEEKRKEEEFFDGITEYFISTITFQPGFTRVNHTYSYYGALGTYFGFSYILTTAKAWNGPIKHFSLVIKLPENSVVHYPDMNLIPYGQYKEMDGRLFIKRGGFFLTETDYVPETNIWMPILGLGYYLVRNVIEGKTITMNELLYGELKESDIADFTKKDLRILRNAIYAWHGYKFNDKELDDYFSSQLWYFPEDDMDIQLTDIQKKNVDLLLKYEREY